MQPLIAGKNPLHFDSDADGSFLGSRRIYGARFGTPDMKSSWFAWLCAHADGAAKAGFAASMIYLFAAALYAAMLGGSWGSIRDKTAALVDNAARSAGFAIDKIVIQGRVHMLEAEVMDALGATTERSILSFDAQQTQQKILAIGWVKSAEIQRIWPSTIVVAVEERSPFALWRHNNQTYAVDADGVVLGPVKADELAGLPRVQGEGAQIAARALLDAVNAHPMVEAKLQDAERISSRRWDIILVEGVRVKLPENAGDAIASLEFLLRDGNLPLAQIASIDLRAPGQAAISARSDTKDARQQILSAAAQGQTAPR